MQRKKEDPPPQKIILFFNDKRRTTTIIIIYLLYTSKKMNDKDNKHIFTAILNEGKEKVLILYCISYIYIYKLYIVRKTKNISRYK